MLSFFYFPCLLKENLLKSNSITWQKLIITWKESEYQRWWESLSLGDQDSGISMSSPLVCLCSPTQVRNQGSCQSPFPWNCLSRFCHGGHAHQTLQQQQGVWRLLVTISTTKSIQWPKKYMIFLPLSMKISVRVPSAYSLSSCLLSDPLASLSSARNISTEEKISSR